MSWRDAMEARRVAYEAAERAGCVDNPVQDLGARARAALLLRGETEESAAIRVNEILGPVQSEAMRKHYQNGEPRAAVDVWYAEAMRDALTKAGLL